MTTTELPSLLERTRMALAEVGYPPEVTRSTDDPEVIQFLRGAVPHQVAWRAASIARGACGMKQLCFACAEAGASLDVDRYADAKARCLADRPCVMDCGVER